MRTYFTVKTTGYSGPELGQRDTVTVQIQRYDKAGMIVSRETLDGIVTEADQIADEGEPVDLSPEGGDGRFTIPDDAEPLVSGELEAKSDEETLGILVDDHDVPNQAADASPTSEYDNRDDS